MTVTTSAAAKVYVGPQAGDAVDSLAEFDALNYTLIGEVQSLGQFGDEAKIVTFEALGDSRVRKSKGARDAGSFEIVCGRDPSDVGQIALKGAQLTNKTYAFKVVGGDAITPQVSGTATITIASPGVVSWNAHGLPNGASVKFATTGALPTGLTVGTTYYVVNKTINTFELAAVPGGTSIVTSGTQSGVHTATGEGTPTWYYMRALVNSARDNYGTNDNIVTMTFSCPIDSEVFERVAV